MAPGAGLSPREAYSSGPSSNYAARAAAAPRIRTPGRLAPAAAPSHSSTYTGLIPNRGIHEQQPIASFLLHAGVSRRRGFSGATSTGNAAHYARSLLQHMVNDG